MKQTITEYARRRGCSRTAVYKAIASGKLSQSVSTDDAGGTLIDPDLADREWAGNHNPAYERTVKSGRQSAEALGGDASASPPVDGGSATLAAAKRAKAVYDAKMAELDYRKKAGDLVEKRKVYEELFTFGREVRNSVLEVPDRILDDLLAAPNRTEAHNMLYDALSAALDRLSSAEPVDLAKDR